MRHVFIISYGRSGSTVLQNVLNMIPGFCIRGENGGIVNDFVAIAAALEEAGHRARRGRNSPRHPWYGIGQSNPESLRKGLADVFVRTVLCPPPGCRATGFREIRYTPIELNDPLFGAVTDFLLGQFEDAQLVFVTRQPEEVARSAWWAEQPTSEVRALIERSNVRFAEAHERNPDSTFLIDYSDFNDQPEGVQSLLDWLGEELPADQIASALADRLTHMQPAPVKLWDLVGYIFK